MDIGPSLDEIALQTRVRAIARKTPIRDAAE
jgi:hypothetical protein